MKILVVGAGSTGGYFGARLAQHGRDVTFLVREKRLKALAQDGLSVKSPHGDFAITPKLVTAPGLQHPFDLILMTVKAFGLDSALDDVAPAVGAETMILPVLNGMRHVEVIRARFGDRALLGGVAKIAATLDAKGQVVQLAPFHALAYGEMDGSRSARIEALDAQMKDAGFDAELSLTIAREMWEKWVMLASLGAITCTMRGTIGQVAATPGGAAYARGVIAELAGIAAKVGIAPEAKSLAYVEGLLTAQDSTLTSSMYRDMQAGSRTEADQILGDLRARAEAAGMHAPLLNAAHTHLMVYQNSQKG